MYCPGLSQWETTMPRMPPKCVSDVYSLTSPRRPLGHVVLAFCRARCTARRFFLVWGRYHRRKGDISREKAKNWDMKEGRATQPNLLRSLLGITLISEALLPAFAGILLKSFRTWRQFFFFNPISTFSGPGYRVRLRKSEPPGYWIVPKRGGRGQGWAHSWSASRETTYTRSTLRCARSGRCLSFAKGVTV